MIVEGQRDIAEALSFWDGPDAELLAEYLTYEEMQQRAGRRGIGWRVYIRARQRLALRISGYAPAR
jgi:hypothetical protein